VGFSSFHGENREADQRAQFMLSAVCADMAQEIRDLAFGRFENEDESQ
jgi:hypothetical protein